MIVSVYAGVMTIADIEHHLASTLGTELSRETISKITWSTLQRKLHDTRTWESPEELGSAIFEWIEAWYSPRRRHTSLGMLAPHEFESLHTTAVTAA